MKKIIAFVLTLFLVTTLSFGNSISLAWDVSLDPTVVSYNVYSGGASLSYTNVVSTGSATIITFTGLVPGKTYYFASTCVTSDGLESGYSSEIAYTVPITINTNKPTPPKTLRIQ